MCPNRMLHHLSVIILLVGVGSNAAYYISVLFPVVVSSASWCSSMCKFPTLDIFWTKGLK